MRAKGKCIRVVHTLFSFIDTVQVSLLSLLSIIESIYVMSRNGYLNYPLGPFEAALISRRNQEKNDLSHKSDSQSRLSAEKKDALPFLGTQSVVSPVDSQELEEKLQHLLTQEQTCEQRFDKACNAVIEKEKHIADQKKILEYQQQSLHELYCYGKAMKQELKGLREKISEIKQQLVSARSQSQERLFTSRSQKGITNTEAMPLPPDYIPGQDTVDMLTQFQSVPISFIQDKLIEFRLYYSETREHRKGWDRCFYSWVIKGWKKERYDEHISPDFRPVETLLQELMAEGIMPDFCEQERKGFILYWQERQGSFTPKLWQERFKQWIQRAWRRHKADEGRAQTSRPTTEEFTDTSWVGKYQFNFDEDD